MLLEILVFANLKFKDIKIRLKKEKKFLNVLILIFSQENNILKLILINISCIKSTDV